ncbi:replicative DNA helicase [Corynebacterium striatum]
MSGNDALKTAEQATLGALMQSPSVVPEVIQRLKPTDFFSPLHGLIYSAILDLYNNDVDIEPAAVGAELERANNLERVGGLPAIFEVYQAAPYSGQVKYHVETIANAAARRRLHDAGLRIVQLAESNEPLDEALNIAQQSLDKATLQDTQHVQSAAEGAAHVVEHVDEIMSGKLPASGLMSGFSVLDETTNGFKPGQMIIVAARPGVGKSTLATDIMREVSIRQGVPSLLFSLEMSSQEVFTRILSAESGIKLSDLIRGNVSMDEREALGRVQQGVSRAPIFVDDSAETTLVDIRAKTKMLVKKHGIKLMLVDYLQLLQSGSKAESRQQEVSEISRSLKLLAKSCGIPVIALAQLNRGVEKRGDDAAPKPSDLRESGSLEQDADQIILIHRPDVNNPEHAKAGEADLILAKHRGGPLVTATVANQLRYAKFVDFAR